jgi:hypothetical protein
VKRKIKSRKGKGGGKSKQRKPSQAKKKQANMNSIAGVYSRITRENSMKEVMENNNLKSAKVGGFQKQTQQAGNKSGRNHKFALGTTF